MNTIGQARANDAITPLLVAAQNARVDACAFLLAAGANPNCAESCHGATPLFVAAQHGNALLVSLLLCRRADVDVKKHNGLSPLLVAAQQGFANVCALLLQAGANVNEVHAPSEATALYKACANSHADVCALLLAHGADPNLTRRASDLPFAIALPLPFAADQGNVDVVDVLLASPDVDVNERERGRGMTALHFACAEMHVAIVMRLLARGADMTIGNYLGDTAMDVVRANRRSNEHSATAVIQALQFHRAVLAARYAGRLHTMCLCAIEPPCTAESSTVALLSVQDLCPIVASFVATSWFP